MYFILSGEVTLSPSPLAQTHRLPSCFQQAKKLMKKKLSPKVVCSFIDLLLASRIRTFEDLISAKFSNFRLVAIKKEGDYFGEIALEQRIPRTASVVSKTECTVGVLTYESYQKILG
jgi:hypothetical protein